MKFNSTRNKNIQLDGHQAIIKGLASDGGLFVPSEISYKISVSDYLNKDYQFIAKDILSIFFNDLSADEISSCVYGAYDQKFDTSEIVPVKKIKDAYLMELWHGPTSAFKDIALTILPRLLTASYKKENLNETVAILTATSGDTGKAALSGFADVPNTAVTVFYPEEGVSAVQKRQMQTARGNNLSVIAVNGNFDDCQRMVKEACSSKPVLDACKNVTISSANSINIGRLVPQIVYYISSYCKLLESNEIKLGDSINFIVPTGNFGDILAGYIAKKMGLPVNKLICASNSNNVLTDFLKTGTYSTKREFHLTMSPSMDILISSNLERLLYFVSDGDTTLISELMNDLSTKGTYTIPGNLLQKIQKDFDAYWTDESLCRNEIHNLYTSEHVLIDPHTSVAYGAYHQYVKNTGDLTPSIVLSTASPFKFCRDVFSSISGLEIDDDFVAMEKLADYTGINVPAGLAELTSLPIRFTEVIEVNDGISRIAKRMGELSHD